jgi:hypothetical protein
VILLGERRKSRCHASIFAGPNGRIAEELIKMGP